MRWCFFYFSACYAFLVQGQTPPTSCPAFTPVTTIARISPADRIFRFDGGFVAIVNEIRLDTDGSPVAYHPQNKGTTHLCNGLDPIIAGARNTDKSNGSPCFAAVRSAIAAGWKRESSPTFCIYGFFAPGTRDARLPGCNLWGGAAGRGELALQEEGDSAPGFFVSTTSATNPGSAGEDRQARYLDADRTPYVVVPGSLMRLGTLKKGGVAWAWNPRSGRTAAAVFGDTQSKFGEVSIALGQKIEKGEIAPITPQSVMGEGSLPWPYGKRPTGEVRLRNSPTGPVAFVYFSTQPEPALPNFEAATIESGAKDVIRKLGGEELLKSCLRPLL